MDGGQAPTKKRRRQSEDPVPEDTGWDLDLIHEIKSGLKAPIQKAKTDQQGGSGVGVSKLALEQLIEVLVPFKLSGQFTLGLLRMHILLDKGYGAVGNVISLLSCSDYGT
jgi:hypothetical protein